MRFCSFELWLKRTKFENMSEERVTGDGLLSKITINNNGIDIYCVRFSPDGKFLAAGCGDGAIRVFNSQNGSLAYTLQGGSNVTLPTTALRFRPVTAAARTKNVFAAANASGVVQHWHMTSAKVLSSMEGDGNLVYALDYNDEGTKFITAGKDSVIRVYDEATKTLLLGMHHGGGALTKVIPGHTNRIFSCKSMPGDENVIISGGWDNTVHIWDIRTGGAVRVFHGPHICGDALDVAGSVIVTGSWRPENQLEEWDLLSGEKIRDVAWNHNTGTGIGTSLASTSNPCMLYATQFSKEGQGRYIAAGGSNCNEAKVFDRFNHNAIIGSLSGLPRGVFALDFSPDNRKIAVAAGDSCIRILEIVN